METSSLQATELRSKYRWSGSSKRNGKEKRGAIMHENENTSPNTTKSATPKPVFMRLLMLFGSGAICLLVGIVVALATGDLILLAMSAILGIAFATKGVLLKRKINSGQVYGVSGVCVGIAPKMLGRYRRIELVDVDTGGDTHIILPKKVTFKIGHVYTCYFDNHIGSRPENLKSQNSGISGADFDLPTNGFLGHEDFGVYQEKPLIKSLESIESLEPAEPSDGEQSDKNTRNEVESE
jgi:hypothetical protein